MNCEGMVVLITGSVSGIGKATAKRLIACGGRPVVHGPDAAQAEATCAEIGAAGWVAGDLADPDVPARLVESTVAQCGRIDGLVNNAADTGRSTLESATVAQFDHQIAVNVRAPFLLIQAAAPHMDSVGGGRVVNIGSVNAWCGERNLFSYAISKGALLTLTRNLGDALGARGIRVNQINPGWVLTENEVRIKRAEGLPEDWPNRLPVDTAPSGTLIDPDEIASTVCFLLSDRAPRISGTVLDYEQYPVIGRNPPKTTV